MGKNEDNEKGGVTERRKLILRTLSAKKSVRTETMLGILNKSGYPCKLETLRKDIYFLKDRGYDVSFRDKNTVILSDIPVSSYYPFVEDLQYTFLQFAVLWHLSSGPASFNTLRKKVSDSLKAEVGDRLFRDDIINPLRDDLMIEYSQKKYHLHHFKFEIIVIPGNPETLVEQIDSFLCEYSFDLPADANRQLCNCLKNHGVDLLEKSYNEASRLNSKQKVAERKKYNITHKTADAQFLFDCLYRMALWSPKTGVKKASDEVSPSVLEKQKEDFNNSLSALECRLDFPERPKTPPMFYEGSLFLILKRSDAQKTRRMLKRFGLI